MVVPPDGDLLQPAYSYEPLKYDSSLKNLETALREMDTPIGGLLDEFDQTHGSKSKNRGSRSPVDGFN